MAAEVKAPPLREFPSPPPILPGAMEKSRPYVASDKIQQAIGFPWPTDRRMGTARDHAHGRDAGQVPLAQGLHGLVRALRGLLGQMPLLHRHAGPEEHAGGAPGPDAQRLPPLLHAAREAFPEARWRARSHQGSARRLVHVLQPVLGMPALLGVLSVRNRHGRGDDGRARNPRRGRLRAEVQQRDHRQGAPRRQQPRPARAGAGRYADRAGRGHQGRNRRRRAHAARRGGRRGAAGHAIGGLLRRAARRQPDRLRQGVSRRRHPLDAVVEGFRGRQLWALHRQLRAVAGNRAAHPRGGARTRRQAHHRWRVRPCMARGLQLLEHAGRHRCRRQGPVRGAAAEPARPALPPADAHLRVHLGPDRAWRAEVRQGSQ